MSSDIRAVWHVTAGTTIGNVLPDYSRSFAFSNEDAEGPASAALFAASARAALEYAYGLYDPDRLRWVRLEFVWNSLATEQAGAATY